MKTAITALVLLLVQQPVLEKKWYTLHELLAAVGEREGVKWAMPETLAGRALVGGSGSGRDAIKQACAALKLTLTESNGILVVHRAPGGNPSGSLWELGWSRDGRAVPMLAEALAASDVSKALEAAQAIEVLCKSIPLGRTDRVEAPLPGRVELAAAFPPKIDPKLFESPYPPIRAAAARLLFAVEPKTADKKTAADRSFLVEQVRQQALFVGGSAGKRKSDLPPLPRTEVDIKAACDKLYSELPRLGGGSEWEQMRTRARTLAAWANSGSEYAFEVLVRCTKFEYPNCAWFAPYAQKCMTSVGGDKAVAKLKEQLPSADRASVARFLEQWQYGAGLMDFFKPYLGEQTVAYVAAWKAGRESVDDLVAIASKGHTSAVDALGAIGGPKAVAALKELLKRDEPHSGTLAFRSAKALGQCGTQEALSALMSALDDRERQRRHAAALFLGRIGGPEAIKRLSELVKKDPDRLVRAGAAAALEEIGAKPEFSDAGLPPLVYQPRNKRFGPEFPANEWVHLKIGILAHDNYGEMGWNYDAANKVFFRYGGCSGYTNEFTIFDLGTERFTQRRPNEEMAGWDQRRPPRGCSGGRTWDPYLKVAWIGMAIGGTEEDLAIAEYYNHSGGFLLSSYDMATDRFRSAAHAPSTTRYAYDWKHGLLYPVSMSHRGQGAKDWTVFATKEGNPYSREAWKNKSNPPGDYPFMGSAGFPNAAVHQDTGLLVVYMTASDGKPPETWTYDPQANAWKNMQPKSMPSAVGGGAMVYDPFHKVMIFQGGKKSTQFGGAQDSVTWTYDPKSNVWTDMNPKNGPGNPWIGAMDFDPEHNVSVVFDFNNKCVWACRYKQVPPGTKAP